MFWAVAGNTRGTVGCPVPLRLLLRAKLLQSRPRHPLASPNTPARDCRYYHLRLVVGRLRLRRLRVPLGARAGRGRLDAWGNRCLLPAPPDRPSPPPAEPLASPPLEHPRRRSRWSHGAAARVPGAGGRRQRWAAPVGRVLAAWWESARDNLATPPPAPPLSTRPHPQSTVDHFRARASTSERAAGAPGGVSEDAT